MMGFTVQSNKTMAQSRADIVNAIIDCDQPSKSEPANVEGQAGVAGRPGTASALRLGQIAADTALGPVLVAYYAGVGTTRTRRKMHIRLSKLALRAILPKRIRRALVSVMDKHADSTVAAVKGVVADKIGVPVNGTYGWVFDKVFLKLTAAPQKKRRPRKQFVLAVCRQDSKHIGVK